MNHHNMDTTMVFTIDEDHYRVDLTDELLVLSRHDPVTGIWIDEARVTPRAAIVLAAIGAELDLSDHDSTHVGRVVPFKRSDREPPCDTRSGALDGVDRSGRNHPSAVSRADHAAMTATGKS
jgi:hypothetical protein